MTLPSGWYRDPRAIRAYIEREHKRLEGSSYGGSNVWIGKVNEFIKRGKNKQQAEELAAKYFLPFMITKGIIPLSKQWSCRPHHNDEDCNVCLFLKGAGIIDQPGKRRYLGEFYSGPEKVAREVLNNEGEMEVQDVAFGNYLAGWRCDVCGDETTDGY